MKNFQVYREDILKSIELIREYVANADFEDFAKNTGMQDAVMRRLEIIGEAASRIPKNVKEQNPEIPWKDIAGFRNIIVHHYDSVKLRTVWNIVGKDLKPLEEQVKAMVDKSEYQG